MVLCLNVIPAMKLGMLSQVAKWRSLFSGMRVKKSCR
ncbi:hypothetical protein OROMI_006840 [Orobanche minor]